MAEMPTEDEGRAKMEPKMTMAARGAMEPMFSFLERVDAIMNELNKMDPDAQFYYLPIGGEVMPEFCRLTIRAYDTHMTGHELTLDVKGLEIRVINNKGDLILDGPGDIVKMDDFRRELAGFVKEWVDAILK